MLDETTNAFKMGSEQAVSNLTQHHLKEATRKRASFPNLLQNLSQGSAQAKSNLYMLEWATLPQAILVLKLVYICLCQSEQLCPSLVHHCQFGLLWGCFCWWFVSFVCVTLLKGVSRSLVIPGACYLPSNRFCLVKGSWLLFIIYILVTIQIISMI